MFFSFLFFSSWVLIVVSISGSLSMIYVHVHVRFGLSSLIQCKSLKHISITEQNINSFIDITCSGYYGCGRFRKGHFNSDEFTFIK